MADFFQIELPPDDDGVDRFCRLARRYVLELGAHDVFKVVGRVRGTRTREIDWSPGQGPAQLRALVNDYQEYFEAVCFPSPDARELRGTVEIYATGVGLRVLNARGDARLAARMEALAAGLDAFDENVVAYATEARRREFALFRAAWSSRAAALEALAPALSDADVGVVAAAVRMIGRFRLAEMLDVVAARLGDPRPEVRRAAVGALKDLGSTAVLPHLVGALHDEDEEVCMAAVEALSSDRMRTALRHDPERLRQVMDRLAALARK